ncbi:MAG: hypothetical protein ACKV0T_30675 [Planctomycetales bacterium]
MGYIDCGEHLITPDGEIVLVDEDWCYVKRARNLSECFEAVLFKHWELLSDVKFRDDQLPVEFRTRRNRVPPLHHKSGVRRVPRLPNADRFSSEVVAIMRRAGWFEHRGVEIGAALAKLHKSGFYIFHAAHKLLFELYGLSFESFIPGNWISFSPQMWHRKYVQGVESATGLVCCKTGDFSLGQGTLGTHLITPDGKMVLLESNWSSVKLARNISDCLEAILLGRSELLSAIDLRDDQKPAKFRAG